jgi:steroid delta-isomerase-like uncharacterized protein
MDLVTVLMGAMVMSIRDIEQLDDLNMKAWDDHDADAFAALFADDFQATDDSVPNVMRTKDEIKQFSQAWFTAFPDMHLRTTNRVVSEDGVGAEVEFIGTNTGPMVMGEQEIPPTNKKVQAHGTYFARVSGGKVVEFHSHPNMMEMMGQLGMAAHR